MENKYYTPSIEEFFVGFEYEELEFIPVKDSHFGIKIKKNVFVEHIWKTGYSNWQFLDNLKEGKIRVKYLDSSDIEELGFIFEEQVVGKITFKYTKNNFIELHKLYTTILILNNGRTIFEGFIKNKSELIRLLGWLNV